MKRTALLFCLLFSLFAASAQQVLTIWRNNTTLEIPIAEIDSITFTVPQPQAIGVFTIGYNKTVAFAPGNLQYINFILSINSSHHLQYITTTDTWTFAANQYEYIGTRNMVNKAFADTIDLFAWSTDTDPSTAWGVTLVEDLELFSGNFVDWGTAIGDGDTWRTLTSAEWEYLRASRANAAQLIGVASVNGSHGLILLPDNWVAPEGITFKSGFSDKEYSSIAFEEYQSFTAQQWATMQAALDPFFVEVDFTGDDNQRHHLLMYPGDTTGKPYYLNGVQYDMYENCKFNLIDTGKREGGKYY